MSLNLARYVWYEKVQMFTCFYFYFYFMPRYIYCLCIDVLCAYLHRFTLIFATIAATSDRSNKWGECE